MAGIHDQVISVFQKAGVVRQGDKARHQKLFSLQLDPVIDLDMVGPGIVSG